MPSARSLKTLAVTAVLFGGLTVFSGGRALFGDAAAQAAAGQAVGFVLWFNFLAGFAYLACGMGLWWGRPWARHLATALAVGTAVVAGAFGWHVAQGGDHELRTVGALALRLGFWCLVAVVAHRQRGPAA